jgi:hypothetical protein
VPSSVRLAWCLSTSVFSSWARASSRNFERAHSFVATAAGRRCAAALCLQVCMVNVLSRSKGQKNLFASDDKQGTRSGSGGLRTPEPRGLWRADLLGLISNQSLGLGDPFEQASHFFGRNVVTLHHCSDRRVCEQLGKAWRPLPCHGQLLPIFRQHGVVPATLPELGLREIRHSSVLALSVHMWYSENHT